MTQLPPPPGAQWRPPPGPAPAAARRRLSRDALVILAVVVVVFAAAAFGVGFLLIGTDDDGSAGSAATPPEVPAPSPHPDTVHGVWEEPVLVLGSGPGGATATVRVTLSEPEVLREIELDNGTVRTPDRDVFFVLAGTIEGTDGTYEYNMQHFQLLPTGELAGWRGDGGSHGPTLVTGVDPALRSGTVAPGSRISGRLMFDVPESALDGSVLVLRSLLVPDDPAAAYWPVSRPADPPG